MSTTRRFLTTGGRLLALGALPRAQAPSFTVTLEPPVRGSVTLTPALPANGQYPAGTVVTVTAKPDAGYAIDSVWYSVPGRFGQAYRETTTQELKVTIDQTSASARRSLPRRWSAISPSPTTSSLPSLE
jgi:hypothetical protein